MPRGLPSEILDRTETDELPGLACVVQAWASQGRPSRWLEDVRRRPNKAESQGDGNFKIVARLLKHSDPVRDWLPDGSALSRNLAHPSDPDRMLQIKKSWRELRPGNGSSRLASLQMQAIPPPGIVGAGLLWRIRAQSVEADVCLAGPHPQRPEHPEWPLPEQPLGSTAPLLFSIVMPVHNVEAYVAESVASVQAQTWQAWELIIVNDGSTDNTRAIIQALAAQDPRIRFLNQPNSGVASARNRGLELIKGELLVFLDGDDLWQRDFLANAAARLSEPGVDCFICGIDRLQPDASLVPVPMKIAAGRLGAEDLIERFLEGKTLLAMGNMALRLTPALRALRFAQGCRHGEDTEYLLRALSILHTAHVQKDSLFLYRIRPGSATQQAWDWNVRVDALHAMERAMLHLIGSAPEERKVRLENLRGQMHYSKYRFLYQMVKTGAWKDLRRFLAQDEWRTILNSVAQHGRHRHRFKARIILGQNLTVWRMVAFYTRFRTWAGLSSRAKC